MRLNPPNDIEIILDDYIQKKLPNLWSIYGECGNRFMVSIYQSEKEVGCIKQETDDSLRIPDLLKLVDRFIDQYLEISSHQRSNPLA